MQRKHIPGVKQECAKMRSTEGQQSASRCAFRCDNAIEGRLLPLSSVLLQWRKELLSSLAKDSRRSGFVTLLRIFLNFCRTKRHLVHVTAAASDSGLTHLTDRLFLAQEF